MTAPEVTQVTFSTTIEPGSPDSPAVFASRLRERTAAHIDRIDVGAVLTAFLAEHPAPAAGPAAEILRLTALVETVLGQARAAVRTGMAVDLATRLIPRLEKREASDH